MPPSGCKLEALILPIGQLEQEQQRVPVHHERMFVLPRVVSRQRGPVLIGFIRV